MATTKVLFITLNRQNLSEHQRGCRKKYQPIVDNTQAN